MNNKETENKKTTWDKAKESFGTALMSAGIVLVVLFLFCIPFKLVPVIYTHGTNYVSTSLSSLFISEDATSTKNIMNENASTKTINTSPVINTTPNNTNVKTTYSNVQIQKTYYGKPDLQIALIGTGIIDPASRQFISTNYAGFNDEIAIRFEVKNVGTNISGPWKLRINTPSRTTPYYDSAYQTSIKPGDRIIFTTSFNSPVSVGINTSYITVDPLNMINEIYENNNQIIVPIQIQGTSYSYNNNYNYGNNIAMPNLPYGTLFTWTNINVNCYANPQTSYPGSPITWYAIASGGDGYFTYSWTGSDSLNGNQSAISKTYYYSGQKMASVIVTSNGQSVTKQCSVYIY